MNMDQEVCSLSDYIKTKELGKGTQGTVFLMEHKEDKRLIACKIIIVGESEGFLKQLQNEVSALIKNIDSKYLIKFYGAFYENNVLALPMEYMNFGSLENIFNYCDKIDYLTLANISYQLLRGLKYMHTKMKVIHRDLKPANIMVNSDGEIKITDFGVSAVIKTGQNYTNSWVGSIFYMAPERMENDKYDYKTDIWSFGCIILQAYLGSLEKPKNITESNALDKMSEFYKYVYHLLDEIKEDALLKDFLSLCFKKLSDRPTASDLLNHEYIKKYKKFVDLKDWISEVVTPIKEAKDNK